MAFVLELRRRRGHSGSMLLVEISPRGGEIKGRPRSEEISRERAEMHDDVCGNESPSQVRVRRWREGGGCGSMSKRGLGT